ncbi:Hemin transport protein HemS [Klebsiella quasipneumoniae subsp. similipneumoniae]|nr:Hemin transport protein HemS [Klebsiella quasipneumoniae subsp. similipneumoniae]
MGISEAELPAARLGHDAVRLSDDARALIAALERVGETKCICRNEYAVHEQVGQFTHQHLSGHAGLVRELADLLMHGILVAADAFGFTDALQGGNQRPGVIAQAHGIMAEAGGGQFGFADPHFRGDIAGIFRGAGRFGGLVALPQVRLCIWHNHILLDDQYPRPAGRGQVRYYSGNQKSTLTPSCQVRPGITASALSLASWLVPVSILRLLR